MTLVHVYSSTVSDILPIYRVVEPKETYILDRLIERLGVHEAKFRIGRHSFHHKVFIARIVGDVYHDIIELD